jgi:NAD(P) transhydrogenase subunit alpha
MTEYSLADLTFGIYVLVLASIIGFEIISKVPTMLHTPLMSGSNAISGIILLGAIIAAARVENNMAAFVAYAAIFFASINLVGGFLVTDRMLGMFRSKKR